MIAKLAEHPNAADLGDNRLFAGIPAELISEIGSTIDLFRFDAEDIIFHEGDEGDSLYLVVQGSVRISKSGRAGQQETLGFIQPGNFFGEMALIDGQPRSAQATATDTSVLGCIAAESFARILESAPHHLHMNFLRSVVERLRGVNSHFITEVMRTERLSLLGTMANTIIHDLRNPLHALMSCTALIASRTDDPEIRQFVGIMEKANGVMVDMVQELLDFAKGQSSLQLTRRPADAIITELDGQLFRLIPPNVQVVRECRCCDDVMVDPGRFARVLLNLIKNAVESMPNGGVLVLGMKQDEGHLTIRVSDTGSGIPAELQARIFEPFITYGKSKGTGLGLAIAKNVVESHGGSISLRSTPRTGTTIEIQLPTFAAEVVAA